jgi:Tol biopolymer transport system component
MLNPTLLLSLAQAKDVMLMNRIGPSRSELFVANADGTAEHRLLNGSSFDYHASYSYDGKWIVFTSERAGYVKPISVVSDRYQTGFR